MDIFFTLTRMLQEVNPSLADAASVQQTVAVGCSLVRAALGQ
jgi:arginase